MPVLRSNSFLVRDVSVAYQKADPTRNNASRYGFKMIDIMPSIIYNKYPKKIRILPTKFSIAFAKPEIADIKLDTNAIIVSNGSPNKLIISTSLVSPNI